MSKTLVIVESPAKARTIGRYLGPSYDIAASVGHVRDLPASTLGVDVKNDFKPRYITMKGKESVIRELKKKKEKAANVILATDPDREGEAIAWHLASSLKLDPSQPCRVAFNEITKKSVEAAIADPHAVDMDLVNAQQARRILDRLVGYELSPLLWNKIRKGLSAGRVQSVTSKLIIDREKEILNFVPEEYWLLTAHLEKESQAFRARYFGEYVKDKAKRNKLESQEDVDTVLKSLEGAQYEVHELKKKKVKRGPFPPYTTSTLQQEASRALGYSSKRTMTVVQQLYEGISIGQEGQTSLLTYIRTDSVRVSADAKLAAKDYILKEYGEEFLPAKPFQFKNKKAAQDAHEAIRPSHFDLEPQKIAAYLTKEQLRLYSLIWNKFMSSQMAPAVYETKTVEIKANTSAFRLRGESLIFAGWQKIYGKIEAKKTEAEDSDDLSKETLPELELAEILKLLKLEKEQKFTKPPARYTEASLIKHLEELGIGRPSTYAPTISTIMSRQYVDKEGRYLFPTELGFMVGELLEQNFSSIIDPKFTAQMEQDLDTVEAGKRDWVDLLASFYPNFHQLVLDAQAKIKKIVVEDEPTGEHCPECEKGMLMIKEGRYGKFIACNNYPDCKFTKNIEVKAKGNCPLCGSGLLQMKTKKKRSRLFYVCDKKGKDKDCKFISWDIPLAKNCESCGSYLVEKSYRRKKYEKCSNKDCETNKKKAKS